MEVGIVSDTHDNLDVVRDAVDVFEGRADAVVHCGDVVAPFSAAPFDGPYDFFAVRGNNDGEWALAETVDGFGTYLGEMGELSLDGSSVAVYHGTSRPVVDALADCGSYDYVFSGHTHERVEAQRGDTTLINPGGIATGPADGSDPPAAVVLDTATGATEWHDLR
jgi:putative phosphoesterase